MQPAGELQELTSCNQGHWRGDGLYFASLTTGYTAGMSLVLETEARDPMNARTAEVRGPSDNIPIKARQSRDKSKTLKLSREQPQTALSTRFDASASCKCTWNADGYHAETLPEDSHLQKTQTEKKKEGEREIPKPCPFLGIKPVSLNSKVLQETCSPRRSGQWQLNLG